MEKEDERAAKRDVNPAARRDAPHPVRPGSDAVAEKEPDDVKATQGAELDPRDQGGITE